MLFLSIFSIILNFRYHETNNQPNLLNTLAQSSQSSLAVKQKRINDINRKQPPRHHVLAKYPKVVFVSIFKQQQPVFQVIYFTKLTPPKYLNKLYKLFFIIIKQMQTIKPQSSTIQLDAIRYKLWSIHKLPVQDIHHALLTLIPLQSIDSFIPMIRECISVSKRDPYLIKYLHLFDMLLNHEVFNRLLHSCLVEFYSKIVSHLFRQSLKSEIEQSKIIRKYWARRIHYRMYEDLKTETYRVTSIDVDNILSVEALQNIRHYYVEVLRMFPHQLLYYLPQINRMSPAHYQSSLNASKAQTLNKPRYQHGDQYTPPYRKEVVVEKNVHQFRNVVNPLNVIPNNYVSSNELNNTSYNSAPLHSYDSVGKLRCQSEETNFDDNLQVIRKAQHLNNHQARYLNPILKAQSNVKQPDCLNEQINCTQSRVAKEKTVKLTEEQGKAKIEHQNQKVYASSILAKLNSLNCHECKQCGKRFQTQQSYKEHVDWHVTSRLKQLDIQEAIQLGSIKNIKKTSFVTSKVWIGQAQQGKDIQFDLPQSDQANLKQLTCYLCGQKIVQSCIGQEWVFKNAIRAVVSDASQNKKLHGVIHRDCWKLAGESGAKLGSSLTYAE